MKGAGLGSGRGQFRSELLHVDGDDIENLPFGLFYGRRRFPLERIDIRTFPFFDDVARPLRSTFAEMPLDRLPRCVDSYPQLGDHLGDTKPPVVMKGGYVG